jgi:hypothetical protein
MKFSNHVTQYAIVEVVGKIHSGLRTQTFFDSRAVRSDVLEEVLC